MNLESSNSAFPAIENTGSKIKQSLRYNTFAKVCPVLLPIFIDGMPTYLPDLGGDLSADFFAGFALRSEFGEE